MSELKKITDIVDFNPKRPLQKGQPASFIDMASLPVDGRDVDRIAQKDFKGGGSKFTNGDTLFARITPCLENGKTAKVSGLADNENAHGSTEFIVMSAKEPTHDEDFVYYIARLPEFRSFATARMEGTSGRQRVPWQALAEFEYSFPEKKQRQKIASILKSIDDKIENNRRMNETLEGMAQAIFKSWFVDFDPVHAKSEALKNGGNDNDVRIAAMCAISGKTANALAQLKSENPDDYAGLTAIADAFPSAFTDSDLGDIPKGWAVTTFGEVSNCFDSKRIPLSKRQREERPGNIPYHGATSVMDYVDEPIFDGIYLLLGEDGSVLKEDGTPFTQYIWGKSWVNNHAHVLQGNNGISTEHLLTFISRTNIAAYITGAVQLKLNQRNMNSIPFLKAHQAINEFFDIRLQALFTAYRNNSVENQSLAETRDALLPKLLSGEIDVSAVETSEGEA